mgnify:CR=1 FL=1
MKKKDQTLEFKKCINQSPCENCNRECEGCEDDCEELDQYIQQELKRKTRKDTYTAGIILCITLVASILIGSAIFFVRKNCIKTEVFQAEATVKDFGAAYKFVLLYEGKEYKIEECEYTDAQKIKYMKKMGEKIPVQVTKNDLWGIEWTSLSFLENPE